jgi:hypothetical protein
MKYGTIRTIATSPKWLAATLFIFIAMTGAGYWKWVGKERSGESSPASAAVLPKPEQLIPQLEEHSAREPPFPVSDDLDRQIRMLDQSIRNVETQLANPYASSK